MPGGKRKRRRVQKPGSVIKKVTQQRPTVVEKAEIRLNKFISNSGVCSRREADELIRDGHVSVNGEEITILGHKVLATDRIEVRGNMKNLKMYKVDIPVAGIYSFNGLLEDGLSDDEVIQKLIETYNEASKRTMAYKSLLVGSVVQFPLAHAKVAK